ncbi:MAG: PAS domain S-box protein [Candidatus Hydrogenedentes bacterium]|nr:PAS domain S-box protein [Candidatus Hydrogenedentota bacterium]
MTDKDDTRLLIAASIETVALAVRYTAYSILVPMYLLGIIEGSNFDLFIITLVVFAHNVFTHWVLLTSRYHFFLTSTNFFIHLTGITLAAYFTGADSGAPEILFVLFLVGFSGYSRRLKSIFMATVSACAAYGLILGVEAFQTGLEIGTGTILVHIVAILLCGWLLGRISEMFRAVEGIYRDQAKALTSSQETLRSILDSAPNPIFVYDESEFVTDVNEPAALMLGLSREQILHKRFRSFFFDDGSLPARFSALRQEGQLRSEEIILSTDGMECTVELYVRSSIQQGKPFYVAVCHDVSAHKDLQEATRLANIRLERLNAELLEVNRLKSAFLGAMGQKLRSPLSAILGYVELMLDEELGNVSEDQRKALQTCRRSALRVLHVMDDALDLRGAADSKEVIVESGRMPPQGK